MSQKIPVRSYVLLMILIYNPNELRAQDATLNCTCGEASTSNSRIVNGVEADKSEFPWIVGIRRKTSPYSFIPNKPFCAGSLISDRFVLTAAHCLESLKDANDWAKSELVFGMHWARSNPPEVELRNIKKAVMRVQYREQNKDYDVALIELDEPIGVKDYVYPICLPYNLEMPKKNPWVIAAGWGRTSYRGRQAEVLMKSKWMEMMPSKTCEEKTKFKERNMLTNRMVCGVSDLTDSCLGDSGGPLMYYHPTYYRWFLVGITSFGWGCNEANDPGVYTNLYNPDILGWITCANKGQMCRE